MKQLKTVSKIKAASLEELSTIIGKAKATIVYAHFH